ncbi:hypothetical protein ABK040_009499 [Willaertia magna]
MKANKTATILLFTICLLTVLFLTFHINAELQVNTNENVNQSPQQTPSVNNNVNKEQVSSPAGQLEQLEKENRKLKKLIKQLRRKQREEDNDIWSPFWNRRRSFFSNFLNEDEDWFNRPFRRFRKLRNELLQQFNTEFNNNDLLSQQQLVEGSNNNNKPLRAIVKKENDNLYSIDLQNIPKHFDKKDIDISIEHGEHVDELKIKAEKKIEGKDGNSYYEFIRSYSFPKGSLKAEDVKAKLENTTLHLTVPLLETVKKEQTKQINVE